MSKFKASVVMVGGEKIYSGFHVDVLTKFLLIFSRDALIMSLRDDIENCAVCRRCVKSNEHRLLYEMTRCL